MLIIGAEAEPVSRYDHCSLQSSDADENPATELVNKTFNICSPKQRWPTLLFLHQELTN